MRLIFIIIITYFFSFDLYSQTSFETLVNSPLTNEFPNQSIEKSNGNIIITASRDNGNQNYKSPYFIEIDKYGNLINENFIKDSSQHFSYYNIVEFKSQIIAVGILFSDYSNSTNNSLIVSELDSNLNIIKTKSFLLDSNTIDIMATCYTQVFSDSILMISGYGIFVDQYSHASFVYTLDSNLELINNKIFSPYIGIIGFYNYIFNESDSLYYSKTNQGVCALNMDLTIDTIFNRLISIRKNYLSSNGQKKYMLSLTFNNYIYLYNLDDNMDTISSQLISINPNYTYPADVRSISAFSKYLYIGITDSINATNLGWGDQDSKLLLTKIDTLGNTIWIKSYGNKDNYYILHDVLATNDGGCLLTADSYEYGLNNYKKDVILIKVDSNGVSTWTRTISKPQLDIKIFPNPSTDYINLSISGGNEIIKQITIFDMQGKQVLVESINSSETKLNISNLAKGAYIIEGVCESGNMFTEKFLKE